MKKHPLEEGDLAKIYRLFFAPLTRFKPLELDLKQWHELLFGAETRNITEYKIEKPFRMPGLYCLAPLLKVQGTGYREVTTGGRLIVRTDTRTPDATDVEWWSGTKSRVFSLNESEWGWVKLHVREV